MQDKINATKSRFDEDLKVVHNSKDLFDLKSKYLGKKGVIKEFASLIRSCSNDERASLGMLVNTLKNHIEHSLECKRASLSEEEEKAFFKQEKIDVSLPGLSEFIGGEHILKQTVGEIIEAFVRLGFSVKEGPNIETEDNNFTLLNFLEDHPARQMHDTFYVDDTTVLRTHTSNVQVREMRKHKPPMKIVASGLCFRNEDVSARSHLLFHQIEAFYIDEKVSLIDLTSVLSSFYNDFFDKEIEVKFRHSYFPFVEPGIEVDIACIECSGTGCSLCKHTGWLEVAGAGMIHPKVLKNGHIDPEKYSGYALGMGVERLVMLKHGITDIRLFLENDIRFLKQFI